MNIPEDFKIRMKQLLEDEFDDFIKSYDEPKAQGIRVNTLKISIEDFKKLVPFELKGQIPWEKSNFYIEEKKPGKSPYHACGLYYLQEPSAMAVAAALGINKEDRVLDLCAAPGGKSTQAASYLSNSGLIVSNEIEPKRARILSENIERLGIKNAIVTNNSPKELLEHFRGYFDKIIVDAPCSGEGMFKKEDAAIEEWSIEKVIGCSKRQSSILNCASKMLRPNGYIVYSTCTFSIEENEKVIGEFLKENNDFELVNIEKNFGFTPGFDIYDNKVLKGAARLFPHRVKGEGHFIALLHKKDGIDINIKQINFNIKKADIKDYLNFCNENLNITIDDNLYISGEKLYSLPKGICEIKGLRVLRGGLHLGELKKNRFEPNHSLAMALKIEDVKKYIDLRVNSKELLSYLKGETIVNSDIEGWCLVNVDGYSIGWGKASKGIIKNHYPKGLRW